MEGQATPLELDAIPVGTALLSAMDSIDRATLGADQLVEVLRAEERLVAHLQARSARTTVHLTARVEDPEFAHLEVGVPLHLSRRASASKVDMAWALARLPRVLRMLEDGLIDWGRARALVHGTDHLDDAEACDLIDGIAEAAPHLTSGQLGARVRRLAIDLHPDDAKDRQDAAVEDRRVHARPQPEGTGDLMGIALPPDRVSAAMAHLNRSARTLKRAGDLRSMDQLRADVFLDLLSGVCHHGNKPAVADITLDLETAMGLADRAGEIPGWGPVIADVARQLVHEVDGELRFHVTDPDRHEVITTVTTRRRPTAAQQRAVEARHPRCTFPGCRMPARDADLDHRRGYASGGETHTANLHPLCRFHHRAKDEGGWSELHVDGHDAAWRSPLGIVHRLRARAP